MKIEVTCPNCKERILVPDNKIYVECPYCSEEFSLPVEDE